MTNTNRPVTRDETTDPILEAARDEAELRAHDRVSPDAVYDAIAAVDLFVEAFLEGARFAATSSD